MTTQIVSMHYGKYKKSYSDCETVRGSYDKMTKTIDVIIPDGRMKPSGVRGEHFHGYELWMRKADGTEWCCRYRAVCEKNAMKRHVKYCKEKGYAPIDPPEGRIAHIYL